MPFVYANHHSFGKLMVLTMCFPCFIDGVFILVTKSCDQGNLCIVIHYKKTKQT
jgi:hypothetical protein